MGRVPPSLKHRRQLRDIQRLFRKTESSVVDHLARSMQKSCKRRPAEPRSGADAAHYEVIGEDLNKGESRGIAEVLISGSSVRLDDHYLRHIAFNGVEVHYAGGALRMDDVIFVNCTFVFDNTLHSRSLSNTLLASSHVNFSTAG